MLFSRRRFLKAGGATAIAGLTGIHSRQILAATSTPQWETAPSMPIATQEIYPAVFHGEIYVGGGFIKSDKPAFFGLAPSTELMIYNPVSKSWRTGPSIPDARHHLGMVTNSKYLYGIGGYFGKKGKAWQLRDTVFRLKHKGESWETGPKLPAPQGESIYQAIDDQIHVIGGRALKSDDHKHKDTGKHLILIDNNHWEEAAPTSLARNSSASAVLNGKIYMLGGRAYADTPPNKTYAEFYDPKADKWTAIQPLPMGIAGISASALNGKLYVFGGEVFGDDGNWKTGKALNSVWSYDEQTDRWQTESPMPAPRHGHGSVTLNDKIYLIGGAHKVGPQDTTNSVLTLGKS